ncbi:LOW QUALITY PROTEIN: uncharacterized protein LOC105426030 [Pogonomyrmex barbatus]|uniref:LOW QUALITY PROTEIN: uncharacterized protein LOC105426030 n=1 Tax=Pogonomyrmex barbatus TaxID=144034 RepID=A0A6I9W2K3_9HYME|nr:LOW QUALITY PROTEIN: uncharacterized protein LOC105426030 [Pogonomyrmex barbatus]
MACYEVCLTLLALITCHVSANYEYGRLKSLNSEIATSPWNKQYEVYESASSEVLPSYSFYKLRKNRSTDRFGSPSEPYPIKKELIEQKSLKKVPFHSFTNKDSTKYKELTHDSGIAHCQEIKSTEKDELQKSITCYNCKDPKTKSTYERCLYNHPEERTSANTNVERYLSAPTNFRYRRFKIHKFSIDKLSTHPRRTDRIIQVQEDSNDETDSVSYDRPPDYSSDYSIPDVSSNYQSSSSNNRPESYKGQETPYSEHSEDISADKCKTVQKDSMTCTVCKDPNTGNDFERCSYSYQPSDKLFSYSKSSSFGKPENNDKSEQTSSDEEQSSDGAENAKESYEEHVPKQSYEASTASEAKNSRDGPEEKKEAVDVGYLDTAKKKAEIEEFMQNFRKEDRSNCKKVMRDKMTCYKCVDEQGFQKEECAFVAGHEPDKDQLAFHEVKEFQVDSTSQKRDYKPSSSTTSSTKTEAVASHARDFKPSSSTKTKTKVEALEPTASASGNSYETRLEKPDNDYPDEASHTGAETKEAEPYDYTSETRSKYDKVLKLTLPAYMFTTSEHEAAFDEIVASSHT